MKYKADLDFFAHTERSSVVDPDVFAPHLALIASLVSASYLVQIVGTHIPDPTVLVWLKQRPNILYFCGHHQRLIGNVFLMTCENKKKKRLPSIPGLSTTRIIVKYVPITWYLLDLYAQDSSSQFLFVLQWDAIERPRMCGGKRKSQELYSMLWSSAQYHFSEYGNTSNDLFCRKWYWYIPKKEVAFYQGLFFI